MFRAAACTLGVLASLPAAAQVARAPGRTIEVMGTGKVSTPPGIATVHLFVAGEGRTPDEASAALQRKQSAIAAALTGLLEGHATLTNTNLVLIEAHDPKCDITGTPRLSEGTCAVVGYVASIEDEFRTDRVDKAGTAAGLAGRLGARDARVTGYELGDERTAYRSAIAAAVDNAHAQAQLLAAANGARLGPALVVRDQNSNWAANDIGVMGMRAVPAQSAPPAPPAPPIDITVKPAPIDTQANIYITYELLP